MDPDTNTPKDEETLENSTEIEATAPVTEVGGGDIVINLESMIKTTMAAIDTQFQQSREFKEMLDDILNNDPGYAGAVEKTKEASKVKQGERARVMKQPQAKDLDDKLKTLKSEMKENQGALSDYLQEYARMAGVNEIIDDNGEAREIAFTARLIRKSFK